MNADAPTGAATHRAPWLLAHHTGSLGDTIVTIPALRAVRAQWPGHRVALLTTAGRGGLGARDVLGGDVLVDEFVEYAHPAPAVRQIQDLWRIARTIRRRRVDLVVSLLPIERPLRPRDRWFFRACGVSDVRGYDARPWPGAASTVGVLREDRLKLLRLAEAGVDAARDPHAQIPLLTLRPEEQHAGAALLAGRGVGRGPRLAMGIAANWTSKNWPLDRFLELGRRAHAAGADVVGVGGSADRAAFDTLIAAWGFGTNVCGEPLRVAAAVLAQCQAFVGVDSGPAHLAASVGTTCVVAGWAGSSPGQWDPIGTGHVVVRLSVPCQGCRATICPTPGHPCMQDMTVDLVWQALEPLLTVA